MDIKLWIKAAREHAGISQEKLGEALGRTKGNISGWERGSHSPSIEQIIEISRLTKYPLDEFVGVHLGGATDLAQQSAESGANPHEYKLSQAHSVSLSQARLAPTMTLEGVIVEGVKLEPIFILAVPDDALGPRYRAGTEFLWTASIGEPQIGAPVIVRDHRGRAWVRLLAEGDDDNRFRAVAKSDAFRTLLSERDGLEIIAWYHGIVGGAFPGS
jgi:transcriptional regulator with XRE-family HTH domain